MQFTELEKEFNQKEVLFVGRNFSDDEKTYKISNNRWDTISVESFNKVTEVYKVTGRDGKSRTVRRRYSGFWDYTFEEFVKKFNPQIFREDPNEVTELKPTKSQFNKLYKFGEYETEYYPGGFPSLSKFKENKDFFNNYIYDKEGYFSGYDNEKPTRFEKFMFKLITKKEVLECMVIAKGLYGKGSDSYKLLEKRAKKMKVTENELSLVENFDSKEFNKDHRFKW